MRAGGTLQPNYPANGYPQVSTGVAGHPGSRPIDPVDLSWPPRSGIPYILTDANVSTNDGLTAVIKATPSISMKLFFNSYLF